MPDAEAPSLNAQSEFTSTLKKRIKQNTEKVNSQFSVSEMELLGDQKTDKAVTLSQRREFNSPG